MSFLVEFATSKSKRNFFASPEEFTRVAREHQKPDCREELYRSMFIYPRAEMERHLRLNNQRIRTYSMKVFPSHLNIDLDGDKHTSAGLKKKLEGLMNCLHIANGIPPESVQYYFSGRGIHAQIHRSVFSFTPSENLHKVVAQTVQSLLLGFRDYDESIYMRVAIFRWPNTWNNAAKCFKIPITYNEAMNFDLNAMTELAQKPRTDFDFSRFVESSGSLDLSSLAREAEDSLGREQNLSRLTNMEVKQDLNPIALNRRKITCVHHITERGPAEGSRHFDLGVISCAFSRQGVPAVATTAFLQQWMRQADDTLPDNTSKYNAQYISEQVAYWYKGGYRPSCTGSNPYSAQMIKHCDPDCMFYKRKNLNQGMLTVDETFAKLERQLQMEAEGRFINLTQILAPGNTGPQLKVYPGTFAILMGPTSIGKTALMQWMTTQIKFGMAYLSLEMAYALMLKRFCQQVLQCTEDGLQNLYMKYKEQIMQAINHINLTTESMTTVELEDLMATMGLNIADVDHIGRMRTESSDPRKATMEVTKTLRNMATNHEHIIFGLSHIARNDARLNVVDMYSGKESGSIENDVHVLMSIQAFDEYPGMVRVTVLKNTNGQNKMQYWLEFNKTTLTFHPVDGFKPQEISNVTT